MLEIGRQIFPSSFSVKLPLSKSILARQLLLDYIYDTPLAHRIDELKGYYLPDDINYLIEALILLEDSKKSNIQSEMTLKVGQSATAFRFLLVLALFESRVVILDSAPLLTKRLSALEFAPFQRIGAHIQFFPDLNRTIIYPTNELNGTLRGDEWRTSQYFSALLLTQPLHPSGLHFIIEEDSSSFSYIRLTQEVIKHYEEGYVSSEGDWSAAAYWYQLMALHPEIEELSFENLNPNSFQPDRLLADIYPHFGVTTDSHNRLHRIEAVAERYDFDLSQSLDLFPSLVLTSISLSLPFEISGIRNLRIKESNRIESVIHNLKALGIDSVQEYEDKVVWLGLKDVPRVTNSIIPIDSFGDHRIAMAFGVLGTSMKDGKLRIFGEESVSKSYPFFFEDLLSHSGG